MVQTQRSTYRRIGVRNGPTCVPLEFVAGMVERMTPAMSASVALGHAHGPMREYESALMAAGRRPPPRATLERLAAATGDAAIEVVDEIEPLLRAKEPLPDGAHALCVGLDRTTTPMEEPIPRERRKPRRKRRKPRIRRAPAPVEVNFRMAYVGVVHIVDEDGDKMLSRRYASTPSDGPHAILERMRADVEHFRQLDPKLPVLAIQDGAPEMWNLLRPMLDRAVGKKQWHELIDWYHATEHINAAVQLFEPEPTNQQRRRLELQQMLKRNRKGALAVHARLSAAAQPLSSRTLTVKQRELLRHADYFSDDRRMNYRRHLHRSWPIGSGALEGACKSLICTRTKRSGQRWHNDGLRRVLTLRALEQSERLAPLWRHVCERHRPSVTPLSSN